MSRETLRTRAYIYDNKSDGCAILPFNSENRQYTIFLAENDHHMELMRRYDAENSDYDFLNKVRKNYQCVNYIENIADPSGSLEDQIFPEKTPKNKILEEIENIIYSKLSMNQQNLFYAYFGEKKTLEEIR